jgi:hypothetical protein
MSSRSRSREPQLPVRRHSKRSRSRESSEERPHKQKTHELSEIHKGLHRFIKTLGDAKAEIPIHELVHAGFHPKSLSCNFASTEDEHILEQSKNLKFLILILLHAYLSNLATLVCTLITQEVAANIVPTPELAAGAAAVAAGAGAEIYAMKHKCGDILEQISALFDKSQIITMNGVNILDQLDMIFIGSVHGLDIHNTTIPVDRLSDVLHEIQRLDNHVVEIVKHRDMNPSMDTIEYAVSSLNFDIFYRCITQSEHFHRFYNELEKQNKETELKDYITKLHATRPNDKNKKSHARRHNDKSFYIYFYENIHNIAYNVFYNHEYVLPFDCESDFDIMVEHLMNETNLEVDPNPGAVATGAVSNSLHNHNYVDNPFISSSDADTPLTRFGSSQGTSSGSSTSPDRLGTVQKQGVPAQPGVTATGSKVTDSSLFSSFRKGGAQLRRRKYTQKRRQTRASARARAMTTHKQKKSAPKQTRRRRGRRFSK